MKVAVVGAPGTGKTTLVEALRTALLAQAATAHIAVTEDCAPGQQHRVDLALLMGMDLPGSNQPTLLQSDAQLRSALAQHGVPYAVVYGSGPARTDCALQAIDYHRQQSAARARRSASDWQWCCDTCSDAACEHRLFTALVNRQTPTSTRDSVRP